MISLLLLDHASWWTDLGMVLKTVLLSMVFAMGFFVISKSAALYFFTGWAFMVIAPVLILGLLIDYINPIVTTGPAHESIFLVVWLSAAFVEIYVFWVPILYALYRRSKKNRGKHFARL